MKKLLIILSLIACCSTEASAQLQKVDSLLSELQVPMRKLDLKKDLTNCIGKMRRVATPSPTTAWDSYRPDQAIQDKERELKEVKRENETLKQKISQAEAAQKELLENTKKNKEILVDHEELILSLVNDMFCLKYDPQNTVKAQSLLSLVEYHELKPDVELLVTNYDAWMIDIFDILQKAENDFIKNGRAWDERGGGEGDRFATQLESCKYKRRADKSWEIAYLENYIDLAKQRIRDYKYKDKRQGALNFSDIADKAAAKSAKK